MWDNNNTYLIESPWGLDATKQVKLLCWNSCHFYALGMTCLNNKVPVSTAWRIRKGWIMSEHKEFIAESYWTTWDFTQTHFFLLMTWVWEEEEGRPSRCSHWRCCAGLGRWDVPEGLGQMGCQAGFSSLESASGPWLEGSSPRISSCDRELVLNMSKWDHWGLRPHCVADRSRNTPRN